MDEPVLAINSVAEIQWDDVADVVVAGFGGAGVVAAIEARQHGAEVIAVDQFAGGGATAVSGGVNYAGNTRFQKEGGVEDSVEDMYQYLWKEGVPVKPETLRRFCERSGDNMEWLSGLGVPYSGRAYTKKCALPPDGYYLYYTGNEKHPDFAAVARPAPRAHRVVTDGFGGHLYYKYLREAALGLGVRFTPHCPVKRLVVDGAGRVVGIEVAPLPESAWQEHDRLYHKVRPWAPLSGTRAEKAIAANDKLEARFTQRRLIRARHGVILTTGGYIYNLDMVKQFRPEVGNAYKAIMRLGSMGCNGSGIRLGESAGAKAELMNRVFVGRIIAPPEDLVYGLLVNSDGERFINEDSYVGTLGEAVARQAAENKGMWLVLEAGHFWGAVRAALNPGKNLFLMFGLPTLLNVVLGGTRRGATLEDIARKCGLNYEGLRRTVEAYNSSMVDPLGKAESYVKPIGAGPYYALNMQIQNPFSFTNSFTLGGLAVDEQTGAVLREDGSAIEGLYAAGRAAVGLCSLGYQSGMAIADTVFSGRRAGAVAAAAELAGDKAGLSA